MAWSITLSKDDRQRLAGVLRGLLITQLIISLIMATFCYNSSIKVLTLLQKKHKYTVFLLYGLILLQVYCVKLHYTSGFRLITWLLRYPHWKRTAEVTKLWLISGTLLAANGILVQAACKNIVKGLMTELSHSLRVGISQYLTEPSWKVLIDTIQVALNCCGAESPSDWHEISWMNVDFFNEDSELVMKPIHRLAGEDGKLLPPVSPFSCCTPFVLTPCYHDPFQQYRDVDDWSGPLSSASLSTQGCAHAAATPLAHAALLLHTLTLLMLLFQIVIVVLTIVLRDSSAEFQTHECANPISQYKMRSEPSVFRGTVAQRRSTRRVRSRGYACLS